MCHQSSYSVKEWQQWGGGFNRSTQHIASSSMSIVVIMLRLGSAQGAIDAFRVARDFTMSCLRNNARSW